MILIPCDKDFEPVVFTIDGMDFKLGKASFLKDCLSRPPLITMIDFIWFIWGYSNLYIRIFASNKSLPSYDFSIRTPITMKRIE